MNKKKIIAYVSLAIVSILMFCFISSGCASCERFGKSCASEYGNGLYRTVNIYSYDGKLIASYEGQLDVEENDSKVLFDLNGKRYIYYNSLVEVIEK